MTTNSAHLLRMLEPAVRPVSTPERTGGSARLPVEARSFEDLLVEAQQENFTEEVDVSAKAEKQPSPLGPLASVDTIENASLRSLIAKHRGL